MSKRGGARGAASLSHEELRARLFDYLYGRLSAEDDARIAAHTRDCEQCRGEGMRHLATERMQAMQQRAKPRRRRGAQPLTIALSILLVVALALAGAIFYGGARDGALRGLLSRATTSAGQILTATPAAPTATVAPTVLKAGAAFGDKNIETVAASPDGKTLAVATNHAPGDAGGVVLYQNGKVVTRLLGFAGFQAPGTLAWSSDGTYLAGTGNATLYVWRVSTGAATAVHLPANTGTDGYVFDWAAQRTVGSYPVSLFVPSGLAQWQAKGQIAAAPAGAGGANNLPASGGPIFALWSATSGARIFRDAANVTQVGVSDADRAAHAALVRWSPDDRYLFWGYPRVPVSAILASPATPPAGTTAIDSPNPAFATVVNAIGQAASANATAIVWPAPDGQTLAIFTAAVTGTDTALVIADAASGATVATVPGVTAPASLPLNALSWESAAPTRVALATGQGAGTEFAPGT